MKKIILLSLACFLVAGVAFAQVKATQKDAIDMVNKAAAYYKANGEAKAFAEFNKKDGQFTDLSKDVYVFALDLTGKMLAHGVNAALIGRDMSGLKDSDGKYFIKDALTIAKTKGSGWIDYNWSNPTTKKIEPKTSYLLKVDNIIIFCGIYK